MDVISSHVPLMLTFTVGDPFPCINKMNLGSNQDKLNLNVYHVFVLFHVLVLFHYVDCLILFCAFN